MMEAFRDRTIKIDVPYNVRLDDEVKIYNKDFGSEKVKGMHIAPHTIEVAAMWAVLTRLAEPKKAGITKVQKLKLYNGKSTPGFTEDSVKELKGAAPRDGMKLLSAKYIETVRAYTQHERVRNRYTGRDEDPDERLMRSIEEKIDIPDSRKDDFRQEIMNYIGALALDGKKFEYNTNARLL